jgi:hypothetical protein
VSTKAAFAFAFCTRISFLRCAANEPATGLPVAFLYRASNPLWAGRRKTRSAEMRKTILTLLAAVAVAFAASSPADAGHKRHHVYKKPIVVGAVVGTIVGVGLYEGWFGNTVTATGLGTTGGALTGGFVAGVATAALIHAATTPCTGFHALLAGKGCKNGKYIGKHKYGWGW